ncbi:MAG: fructose-bisphosphate aldolase, partial [Bacteroidota bacterium]|nr:fructose-bisphosphate aldolase [Bacteroidota bacterium]
MDKNKIAELLGGDADSLLNHTCKTISKDLIMVPGNDFIDRSFKDTNRSPQ